MHNRGIVHTFPVVAVNTLDECLHVSCLKSVHRHSQMVDWSRCENNFVQLAAILSVAFACLVGEVKL